MKQLKAVPSNSVELYCIENDTARIPFEHTQEQIVLALSKLRRHIYIFQNRRAFKSALESQVRLSRIKPVRLLTLDMPVRWNSTYEIINIACQQEVPITAVCTTQKIDLSIHEIMLTQDD